MVVAMNENEQPQDPELDQLLERWAERRQATKDLDPLRVQITSAWQEEAEQRPDASVSPRAPFVWPRYTMRTRVIWFALGVAAAVIFAVGVSLVRDDNSRNVPVPPAPDFVGLQTHQVTEKAKLLREMERLFENRLEWVAETDGRVLLEIRREGPDEGRIPAPIGLAVRVVVVRRTPGQSQWNSVWAVDLVARQEQVIRLTPESGALPEGAELFLWAYAADEQMVAVDSSLSLGGLPVESTFSGMQQSGIPTVVHATERSGVQYQVFQTVAILDNEV